MDLLELDVRETQNSYIMAEKSTQCAQNAF